MDTPKDSKIAFVGLYSFKGVAKPERVYAAGILESHIQPPSSSEKAKRLGGKKKVNAFKDGLLILSEMIKLFINYKILRNSKI